MKKAQELAEKTWQSIQKSSTNSDLTWKSFVSDPFPVKWPTEPNGTFIIYAQARAVDIKNITAGEFKGPVWARMTLSNLKAEPQLEVLSTALKAGDRQGVRPLTQEEIKTLDVKVLDLFQQKMNPDSEKKIKSYYKLQQDLGNIPQEIEAKHADFFVWLKEN